MWVIGTTSTCVGAIGLRSRNANVRSVRSTLAAGMSPATILQNKQSATHSEANEWGRLSGMADALDAKLATWLAEAAVDEAASERLRERVLRQLAVEEATFLGLCLDLAEARRPVIIRTAFGRMHRAVIVAVGADFVALRTQSRDAVLIPVSGLGAIRSEPGAAGSLRRAAPSDRRPPLVARFVDILTGLAGDRPRVRIAVDGEPEMLFGKIRGCGADVVSVDLGDDAPVLTWLPVRSIVELDLLDER